eukprot:TRINITY_DN32491_c0_g1_i1.p1 TRINITY_DN32491_c0_g1~~TRINITY_DN32491_c0_g1_i1.p1  ORF type:complete len:320 (-),score=45.77 TRINITY_DN32491_c0_g1_i1:105-1064(-)
MARCILFLVCAVTVSAGGVPQHVRDLAKGVDQELKQRSVSLLDAADLVSDILRLAFQASSLADRSLDFLEVFSGSGGITKCVTKSRLTARAFDRQTRDWSEDICTPAGLLWLYMSVLELKDGALMWLSPQCSTWLLLTRGHTRRNKSNWGGDDSRTDVKEGNYTSVILSVLVSLAIARNVFFVIEQPISSALYNMPSLRSTINDLGAERFVTSLAAYGAGSLKLLELYTNIPGAIIAPALVRDGRQGRLCVKFARMIFKKPQQPTEFTTANVTKKVIKKRISGGWPGKQWVRGTSKMKESAAYPSQFCQAVANMFVGMR